MGAFRGSKDLKAAKAAEQEALGRRKYGVGSAWNQYLAASKQDKAADLQRQIAAEQEATSIDALKAGGAKALLGGLGATQRQAAQQRMGIEAESQARQQAALGQYAGVQQRAADANVALASLDVQRAQEQMDAAQQLKRGSFDDLVTGAAGLGLQQYAHATGQTYGNGGNVIGEIRENHRKDRAKLRADYSGAERRARVAEDRIKQKEEVHKELKAIAPKAYERRLERADAAMEAGSEILRKMTTGRREEPFTFNRDTRDVDQEGQKYTLEEFMRMSQGLGGGTGGSGEFGGDSADNLEIVTDSSGNPVKNAQGQTKYRDKITGETAFYKAGGVQKTPGEFSHAKNPIDIMKDGAKIGEMTGGEYIFNPRQSSTLQSLASKGGSPLHKYVRNLLNEFDKR
jgi:hypothetical protein